MQISSYSEAVITLMKLPQIIAIIICLSLALIVAGCTDSANTPFETTSEQPVTNVQNTITPSGQNFTVNFLDVVKVTLL